jgi:UDP-N-acetylmuramoyl-tripeptide--D-alanyl-D-alanine ligase
MKELGEESLTEHQQIVDLLITLSFKQVFLIGPEFSKTKHPKGWSIETWDEALHIISHKNIQQAMILVKGSRSMQMERILSLY